MDAILEWKLSGKVEGLVDALAKCKQELTNHCFSKNGAAKAIVSEVYASDKIVELLETSEIWKPIVHEEVEADTSTASARVQHVTSKPVGDMGFFEVHVANVMGDEQVRLLVIFDVGTKVDQTWFGNVVVKH